MKINVTPRARRDQNEIVDYLASESVDAALLFTAKLRETYEVVAAQPRIGHFRTDVKGEANRVLRCIAVNGFPNHLVFYQARAECIDIARIVHGARDIQSAIDESED